MSDNMQPRNVIYFKTNADPNFKQQLTKAGFLHTGSAGTNEVYGRRIGRDVMPMVAELMVITGRCEHGQDIRFLRTVLELRGNKGLAFILHRASEFISNGVSGCVSIEIAIPNRSEWSIPEAHVGSAIYAAEAFVDVVFGLTRNKMIRAGTWGIAQRLILDGIPNTDRILASADERIATALKTIETDQEFERAMQLVTGLHPPISGHYGVVG
ncbi:hypothetical protein KKF81_04310 [Candidatus Micrarchaeota archaeon]|nr:hypothetical protein [Candidatus Micrarchaeota archaeon]MBU1887307.1 hypothetical protein [Candidatus Micrarchaeota archaeon]